MPPPWLSWSLASAFFAALTAVLAKLGVSGVDANMATAIRTSVVVLLSWGIVAASPAAGGSAQISRSAMLFLVLSGLATGASWLCYFHALRLGPLARVAPVDKLSVVLAVVYGVVFLGETLTWKAACGAFLIVAGVMMIAWE